MTTQPALFAEQSEYQAALARIGELQAERDEAVAAGERQASINLELLRQLDVVCAPCRALIDEAMRDEVDG